MSKLDELYRLHRLLDGRRTGTSRATLIDGHGFARSTLSRLIADLRHKLSAPLIHDKERGGYRYDSTDGHHHLPGLWFSSEELLALITFNQLLQTLQPGLLDDHLRPLQARLDQILQAEHLGGGEATKRIRVLAMAARNKTMQHFQTVAAAVLQRKQLHIDYFNRDRNETSHRELSPQRLAHYRDNWYLDAWCHKKKGLRIFAVECIRHAEALNKPAKAVAEKVLNKELASSYGIFAGKPVATAVLHFTAKRARWIADEIWHPQQKSRWLDDGRFELSVQYSNDKELIMDILKYGADVEVASPPELRAVVKKQLDEAVSQYRQGVASGSVFEPGRA